jgi:hypothetical protein
MPKDESFLRIVRIFNGKTYYVTVKEARGPAQQVSKPALSTGNAANKLTPKPTEQVEYVPIGIHLPIPPASMSLKLEKGKISPRQLKNKRAKQIKSDLRMLKHEALLKSRKEAALKAKHVFIPEESVPKAAPIIHSRLVSEDELTPVKYAWKNLCKKHNADGRIFSSIPCNLRCEQLPCLQVKQDHKRGDSYIFPQEECKLAYFNDIMLLWKIMRVHLKGKKTHDSVVRTMCKCGMCKLSNIPVWERDEKSDLKPVDMVYDQDSYGYGDH